MLRAAAFVIALALAAIAAGSPAFCIDGCDRSDAAQHSAPASCGGCVTCQAATVPAVQTGPASSPLAMAFASPAHERVSSRHTHRVEHPPRTA